MNKKGFSLLTTMVYAAIITTVALGIATVIAQSSKAVNAVGAKINENLLSQAVNSRLSNKVACQAAFGGQAFNVGRASLAISDDDQSQFKNGSVITGIDLSSYGVGNLINTDNDPNNPIPSQTLQAYYLRTSKLRFLNARALGPNPDPAFSTDFIYTTEVWGQFESDKPVLGSTLLKPVRLAFVALSVNGTTIRTCENIQDYPMAVCASLGKIYLPLGMQKGQHAANADPTFHCVDASAWQGDKGDQGFTGQTGGVGAIGPGGATGNTGPQGIPGVPFGAPPAPAPPPPIPIPVPLPPPVPKFSDLRVKTIQMPFVDVDVDRSTGVEALEMSLINRMRLQQVEVGEVEAKMNSLRLETHGRSAQ